MNEFIKKLIERLDKLKSKAEQDMNYYKELSEEDASCEVFADASKKEYEAYCKSIGIVNQLAEEYKNESVKGDLIKRSDVYKLFDELYNKLDGAKAGERRFIREYKTLIFGIPTAYNDDWIPCSEKLPPKPKENPLLENKQLEIYLVAINKTDYPFRAFWNGKFFTDGWSKVETIAWKPIARYQTKEE